MIIAIIIIIVILCVIMLFLNKNENYTDAVLQQLVAKDPQDTYLTGDAHVYPYYNPYYYYPDYYPNYYPYRYPYYSILRPKKSQQLPYI